MRKIRTTREDLDPEEERAFRRPADVTMGIITTTSTRMTREIAVPGDKIPWDIEMVMMMGTMGVTLGMVAEGILTPGGPAMTNDTCERDQNEEPE